MDDSNGKKNGKKTGQVRNASNVATLSSVRDDSDPGGQAFYAGGSEHSGQQVLGPQARDRNADQIVAEMFRLARAHAIPDDEDIDRDESPKKTSFSGTGNTLGSSSEPSKIIHFGDGSGRGKQNEFRTIKMWRNGFSVDDGELRSYTEPANAEFLKAIRSGQIPAELARSGKPSEVHVKMEDHHTEEYKPPAKPRVQLFGGGGQRLGAPTGEIITGTGNDNKLPQSSSSSGNENGAVPGFDANKPNTRVQIRLADGSRLIAEINLDRPVSDLRHFICDQRPEYAGIAFQLMTTFPSKVIDDETVNIKDAGLANASVVQRILK